MKQFSPVVWAVALVLAAVACGWTMVLYVSYISRIPQPAFFAVPFLFAGAVLAPRAWGLPRLERSWKPTPSDHARHRTFHDASLMLLGGSWVTLFYDRGVAPAPVEVGVLFHTRLAVSMDAPVSICWRRFDHAVEGNPA